LSSVDAQDQAPPSSAVRCIHPDRRSLIEPANARGL
jgi:hypothetical protein